MSLFYDTYLVPLGLLTYQGVGEGEEDHPFLEVGVEGVDHRRPSSLGAAEGVLAGRHFRRALEEVVGVGVHPLVGLPGSY